MIHYEDFIQQCVEQVWWQWNAGEVRWREAIPQETDQRRALWNKSPFDIGRDVWDAVEARYGKYGRKV